jgi:hypothetical protein
VKDLVGVLQPPRPRTPSAYPLNRSSWSLAMCDIDTAGLHQPGGDRGPAAAGQGRQRELHTALRSLVPTANGVGRECRWGWVEWVRRLLPRTNKIGHVMIIWNPANRTTIEVSINTSPVGEERLRKKNVRLVACRARCAPRVAMQILRHSRISEIYSQVAATSTREALGRLGATPAIKAKSPTAAVCCCKVLCVRLSADAESGLDKGK